MGFRKEVREFIAKHDAEANLIIQLQKQNQDLMDRLMARDFGELKTFNPTFPEIEKKEEEYDPTKDETAVGEIY